MEKPHAIYRQTGFTYHSSYLYIKTFYNSSKSTTARVMPITVVFSETVLQDTRAFVLRAKMNAWKVTRHSC